ncbi:uncharacterized protein DDB_G0288805-like [Hyperolius riggenbachi]|uniref:uncharacterized protein DDB_G0288805-like n=1 Tax=Hyperolius riggenbachi TaxID=752182 RepID=UPI0035A3A9CB
MMEDRDIQDAEYNRWQELVRNTVRSMPKVARRFVTRPYRKRKTSNPPDYASYASSNTANQHDQPEEPSERDQETMNLPVKKVNNHTIIPQKANSCNATADKSSVGNKMAENGRRSEKRGHGKNQEHCELLNVTKVSDTQHTRQTDGTAVQNTVKLSKKKSTTTNVNNISDSLVTNDNDCAHNVNNRQQSSQRSVGKEKSTDNVLTNVSRPSCRPSVDFEVHDAVHAGSDSGCGNLHSDSQNSSISEDIVIGRAGKQKSQVPSGRKSKAKSNCQAVQPYYKHAQLSTTPCSGSMQIVPAHNREFDMTCKLLEVQQTTLQLLATIAEGQKQMLDNQKGMLKEMKQKNKRRKHKNNYRQAESSDFED